MKIAIFFLLVGLSSCFVSAGHGGLESCRGKLSVTKAEVLITMIYQIIHKYAKLQDLKAKGKDTSREVGCLVDAVFMIVKVVASYKQCDDDIIFEEVMICLKISPIEKAKIRAAFERDDPWAAASFTADPHDLIEAVCCSAAKFINAEGLDFVSLLNVVLFGLNGYVGSLVNSVAGLVSSLLHVSCNLVDSGNGLAIQVTGLLDTDGGNLGSVLDIII
ncbi:uncharacterized protein LOC143773828 [Ranitomeya variabilis]|uniref:uncharacterized protein LOC143773828 n=1 Tax=Ranitomeya variabilis TaxID=490064 RepID=UPI004055DA4C